MAFWLWKYIGINSTIIFAYYFFTCIMILIPITAGVIFISKHKFFICSLFPLNLLLIFIYLFSLNLPNELIEFFTYPIYIPVNQINFILIIYAIYALYTKSCAKRKWIDAIINKWAVWGLPLLIFFGIALITAFRYVYVPNSSNVKIFNKYDIIPVAVEEEVLNFTLILTYLIIPILGCFHRLSGEKNGMLFS